MHRAPHRDQQHQTRQRQNHLVSDGAGRLIGLDNGDPFSDEDFKTNRRAAFNGLCLAVVQSAGAPGPIQIVVTSPGLKPGILTVIAKA